MIEPSIFTKIINNEIPCHRVYEDNRVIAFLTIHPLNSGHTLVVPKIQVENIWDLEPDDYNYLWNTAKTIAKHLRSTLKVDRVGVIVKGFEVPHTHIHLVPVSFHSGVSFDPEIDPAIADDSELAEIAKQIRL